MPDAIAILPAAGRGSRVGVAKQFLELGGRPLLVHAAAAAAACPDIAGLVIAAPAGDEERVRSLLHAHGLGPRLLAVVPGGAERADSVRVALAVSNAPLVAVHDAARPFATPALFSRVLDAARLHGAAIAALPAQDTVKRVAGETIRETLDRREIWLAQTPQCFRVELLREAHRHAGAAASTATDEANLVEAAGYPVHLVPGEKENFKVTEAADLDRARTILERPAAVGFGFDVHAFAEGRRCVLGGVEFPGETGLLGHSDADAPVHALMDALLGAAGLGDIGQHFPDADERFRGADSIRLLAETVRRIEDRGYYPINVDLTIAAARPRIGPRREAMRERLAAALHLDCDRVNIKATTTEGLGFVGRAEGIAAQAVVLLGRRR